MWKVYTNNYTLKATIQVFQKNYFVLWIDAYYIIWFGQDITCKIIQISKFQKSLYKTAIAVYKLRNLWNLENKNKNLNLNKIDLKT